MTSADQRDNGALPEIVRAFAARAARAGPPPCQVRITQRGEMWLKPSGRALAFTATQWLAVERVAFSWRARFPLAGPLGLNVVDDYDDGGGGLEVRLLGLPVQRQRGAQTSAGEALRYLAELAFVPPAIVQNRALEWRQLDERVVEVATSVTGERLAVEVEFDEDGDIIRTASRMRRRKIDGEWQPTPWGGELASYAQFDKLRLPTRGQAYWDLPEGRYVYWRGTITAAEALQQPFRRDAPSS